MKLLRLAGIVLVLAFAQGAFAADAFDLAGRAPKDALMVLTWTGADAIAGDFDKTYYAEVYKEPDVYMFLSSPTLGLWRGIMGDLREAGGKEKAESIAGLLEQLWRSPGMICAVPEKPSDAWPATIAIAAEWRINDPGHMLRDKFKTWMDKEFDDDSAVLKVGNVTYRRLSADMPLYMAIRKKSWIIVLGNSAAEAMAKKRSGPKSFAATARHKNAVAAMGEIKPWLYCSLDVQRTFRHIVDGAVSISGLTGEAQTTAMRVITMTSAAAAGPALLSSGLLMLGSGEFSMACEFEGKFLHTAMCSRPAEQDTWAADYVADKAVDASRLSEVPVETDSFTLCSIDAQRMFDETLNTVRSRWAEANKSGSANSTPPNLRQMLEDKVGIKLPARLLKYIGQHLLIYTMKGDSEWVYAVDIKDRGAVDGIVTQTLMALSTEITFTPEDFADAKLFKIVFKDPFGHMITPITLLRIKPCIGLSDTRLVVASHHDHIKQYFKRLKSGGSGEGTPELHPAIKPFMDEHKDKQFGLISWQDESKRFATAFQALNMSGYWFSALTASQKFPTNPMGPPNPGKFTEHMAPTRAWVELKDGTRVRHAQTSATISTGTLVGAFIASYAISQPMMMREMEISNRDTCAEHMRELGSAIYRYSYEHEDKFPPTLEALMEAGNVWPDLFYCPSSEADYDGLHGCYEYIPGVTGKSDPSLIVLYEINNPHGGAGSNVLFQDGHVEWIAPYSRVLELVEETKKKLAAG